MQDLNRPEHTNLNILKKSEERLRAGLHAELTRLDAISAMMMRFVFNKISC